MRDEEKEDLGPSRSALKRAAKDVERMAHDLVELPDATFRKLPASGDLLEELRQARGTGGHSSRKRQIRHLAALLRRDAEAAAELGAFLAGSHEQHYRDQAVFHRLESLRDQLCDPQLFDGALEEVRLKFPTVDIEAVAGLARSFHTSRDKRAFREIFRRLSAAGPSRS